MPAASMRSSVTRRFASRSPTLEPRERKACFKAFSEQRILSATAHLPRNLEIFERPIGADAAARRAVDETELHEVRFVDFLNGVSFFVDGSGDGVHAHRPAAVLFKQRQHDLLVNFIETETVHFEQVERTGGDPQIDVPLGADLSVIADAAQQAVGNAGRATAASGDFFGSVRINGYR